MGDQDETATERRYRMILYLPYDQDGLISIDIEIYQNEDYDWVLQAEILENQVFGLPDDQRSLHRFVDSRGCFSRVMSPMDDQMVPALPDRNEEQEGCIKKMRLTFSGRNALRDAEETYNGILFDLDEYIRAKKLFEDQNMTDVREIYVVPK